MKNSPTNWQQLDRLNSGSTHQLRGATHQLTCSTHQLRCVTHQFYNSQSEILPVVVVEGNGPDLIGRNWLSHIRLDLQNICLVNSSKLDQVFLEFSDVFKD